MTKDEFTVGVVKQVDTLGCGPSAHKGRASSTLVPHPNSSPRSVAVTHRSYKPAKAPD